MMSQLMRLMLIKQGEGVTIDGSAVAPFELVDSLLGEVTTPIEV